MAALYTPTNSSAPTATAQIIYTPHIRKAYGDIVTHLEQKHKR